MIGDVSATTTVESSALTLSCPKLTKCLTVLLEVCRREVVHLVILQERIDLHARPEAKDPAKLCGCKGVRSICFECETFKRCAGKVVPPGSEFLHDVFGQFQCNLFSRAFRPIVASSGRPDPYMFPREDGIILGGTHERGNWDLQPNAAAQARILEGDEKVFRGMAAAA